jgi:pilus assembly protein TadC
MAGDLISQIGRLLPREQVRKLGRLTSSSGVDIAEEFAAGMAIILPLIVLIISLGVLALLQLDPIIIILGSIGICLIVIGVIYEILLMRIDTRRKLVEEALPDYLQLSAANIRAGMQLDKALWYAAKPEFGVLSKEIELASKRVFSGETIEDALMKMAGRFQSRYLTRTVDLIREGVISGGEMAGILEKTAIDLRDMQLMQKEISASMIMYSIFIAFAAGIGAPFLYVVSYKLLGLFEQVRLTMPTGTEAIPSTMVKMSGTGIGISSAEFAIFSLAMVVVTGVIACMIMAVIQSGKKRDAIKYVLPFLMVALSVFYIGRWILDQFFKAFII